jgi:hypothetical protein
VTDLPVPIPRSPGLRKIESCCGCSGSVDKTLLRRAQLKPPAAVAPSVLVGLVSFRPQLTLRPRSSASIRASGVGSHVPDQMTCSTRPRRCLSSTANLRHRDSLTTDANATLFAAVQQSLSPASILVRITITEWTAIPDSPLSERARVDQMYNEHR